MSAYKDAVLATAGLVNYWLAGADTPADVASFQDIVGGLHGVPGESNALGVEAASAGFDFNQTNNYVETATVFRRQYAPRILCATPAAALAVPATLVCWMQPTVDSATLTSTDRAFLFGTHALIGGLDFGLTSSRGFKLNIGNGSSDSAWVHTSAVGIAPGSWFTGWWHHLALALDDTSAAIWVNGSKIHTETISTGTKQVYSPTKRPVLGNGHLAQTGNESNVPYAFDGKIQHLSLFNRKLADNEITALVAAGGPADIYKQTVPYLGHPPSHEPRISFMPLIDSPAGAAQQRLSSGQLWPRGA
jgi:hypothetical protein